MSVTWHDSSIFYSSAGNREQLALDKRQSQKGEREGIIDRVFKM
jgi:hypothetical protein